MFKNCEGESVTRMESCSLAAVRRVGAMLDLDPGVLVEGDPLPRGWQFILLGADTRRSDLRSDGFPGLGVPMPDLGLPRLLLGGRTVDYCHDIPIGSMVKRVSRITSLTRKTAAQGDMAVVTIAHELHVPAASTAAIVETQTYILLSEKNSAVEPDGMPQAVSAERSTIVTPDETLLFQYSALGFNSHKIHIDKAYARDVEGFPDLVVNGGLVTLLLTEFLRTDLNLIPMRFRTKHLAPLFCGRPITLAADRDGNAWRLRAYNDAGKIAAEMEVYTNEL
ncbi:MAG: 3-methylfumaryl-CoA hydratase [Burkholderiales bacterium]